MALTVNGTRFLAAARNRGLQLRDTTVVGRQGLFAPPSLLRTIFANHQVPIGAAEEEFFARDEAEWADPVFRTLGARALEFLDASAYEGATRLHDLNQRIAPSWEESTDTVIDIGSLEHIFDAKTAIENYLRMARVGGSILLLDMPAVNFCGHGFYQFSPEFFCEVFSARHGFELVELSLCEDWAFAPFYDVAAPRAVQRRVEILCGRPCHLFVHARKIASFQGFPGSVVQSDYAEAWKHTQPPAARKNTGLGERVRTIWRRLDLPGYWQFSTRRNKQHLAKRMTVGRNPDLRLRSDL